MSCLSQLKTQVKEAYEDVDLDFETEFFMKHNFMKECTSSYVVYIQDALVDRGKKVLERHLKFHKGDKCRVIFKTGEITLTLYIKPKIKNSYSKWKSDQEPGFYSRKVVIILS